MPRRCPFGAPASRVWITAGPSDEGAAWCVRCIGNGPHALALWQTLPPESLPPLTEGTSVRLR
eukprot:7163281-Pyramimonas_sp.AAC.1